MADKHLTGTESTGTHNPEDKHPAPHHVETAEEKRQREAAEAKLHGKAVVTDPPEIKPEELSKAGAHQHAKSEEKTVKAAAVITQHLQIGTEQLTSKGREGNKLLNVVRGVNGTKVVDHKEGDVVSYIEKSGSASAKSTLAKDLPIYGVVILLESADGFPT